MASFTMATGDIMVVSGSPRMMESLHMMGRVSLRNHGSEWQPENDGEPSYVGEGEPTKSW